MPVAVLIGPAKPCRNELFCVPVRLVVPGLERFITAADPGDVPGADVMAAVVELNDILGEAGPDERSHDNGRAVTGHQTARRQVLRVEEFLPCPKERVWRALTDPDLIARWLMPNDFRLEAGRRFAIDSDPIRQCGLGGTGHCEVLAFDDGKMLRIAWTAAHQDMSGLDSAVTITVAPEGAGTRLLIEHDGLHPCPYTVTSIACGPGGCRSSTRRIGEVSATLDVWRAAIRRIWEALPGDTAD
jgi:uncharacterized protein YndB with AHSA1/START domain